MNILSTVLFVLLALWFLVGVVPVPAVPFISGLYGLPKRRPVLFSLVALVLLGVAIALDVAAG